MASSLFGLLVQFFKHNYSDANISIFRAQGFLHLLFMQNMLVQTESAYRSPNRLF